MLSKQTISIRFLSTLSTNIVRAILSFISGLIIARALGPEGYGDYRFLLGSFVVFGTLMDMGSHTAFYTFISQEQRGRKFHLYYFLWVLVQFIIILLITICLPPIMKQKIWFGHPTSLILWALFSSFTMGQIWKFTGQIGESIRDTISVQLRNLFASVSFFGFILFLYIFNYLSIMSLYILSGSLYLLFALFYIIRLSKKGIFANNRQESLFRIVGEFKKYCYPMVPFIVIGFFYGFADYWLLQKFGGSAQQGFYAVGKKFSAISLLAMTSILQVFWKEIAEAYKQGKISKVQQLYSKTTHFLYFIVSACSCFLIPFSKEIIVLTLGPIYENAWIPLSIMFLYPLHQTIGQLNGTMLYAMGLTKKLSVVGIFTMMFSMPFTYFVLAPKSFFIPGFNLGAVGLSLKMVFVNIIGVNIMAYFVCKHINLKNNWIHQIFVASLLLPIGFLGRMSSNTLLSFTPFSQSIVVSMFCALIIYLLLVVIAVYIFPSLIGVRRSQLHGEWMRMKDYLKSRVR